MGSHRMFTNVITDSDAFIEMPLSAQALYFHLGLHADDYGFVSSPKRMVRAISCNEDDLRLLIAKGFVISFDSGVIVITHWNLHNSIRKDRKKDTLFSAEKSTLLLENNIYYKDCGSRPTTNCQPNDNQLTTNCQPNDNQLSAKCPPKISKDKISKYNNIVEQGSTAYSSEIEEIIDYLNQRTGKSFRTSTAKTKALIIARLKENYSVDDFKKVIDIKCGEWISTDNSKYLRPETLFGNKFEGYLNSGTIQSNNAIDPYAGYKIATEQYNYSEEE